MTTPDDQAPEEEVRPRAEPQKEDNELGLYLLCRGQVGEQFEVTGSLTHLRQTYREFKRLGIKVILCKRRGVVTDQDVFLITSHDNVWRRN